MVANRQPTTEASNKLMAATLACSLITPTSAKTQHVEAQGKASTAIWTTAQDFID
jgi:hypothetical protein